MKDLFHTVVFILVFMIGAVLPLVGGILFVVCGALGLIDVKL